MVGKTRFVTAVLDLKKNKTFVVYVVFFAFFDEIHFSYKAQIALLKVAGALITVFSEYFNYTDVFSPGLVEELLKYIEINNHAINFVDTKQPLY